jgi:hypothetical protein
VGAAPFEQIQIWVLIGRNGLLQIRTNLNALRHGSGTDENHIHHTTIVIDRIAQLLFMARAQVLGVRVLTTKFQAGSDLEIYRGKTKRLGRAILRK